MECVNCHKKKLSKEFPPEKVTKECHHYISYCLRCMVTHIRTHWSCPQCKAKVEEDSKMLELYEAIMERLYKVDMSSSVTSEQTDVIKIITLAGNSTCVKFDPEMTIECLKKTLAADDKVGNPDFHKQKLIFQQKELKVYGESYELLKIKDFGVKPDSLIHLIVLLYTVGNSRKLDFHIEWQFPKNSPILSKFLPAKFTNYIDRDFVDATCFIYSIDSYLGHVDSKRLNYKDGTITHSRSTFEVIDRKGDQHIMIKLSQIPKKVKHLFFTLSARYADKLSKFESLKLKLNEKNDEVLENLFVTSYTTDSSYEQAIIMCSLSKNSDDVWQVFKYGQPCEGNRDTYPKLQAKLKDLICGFSLTSVDKN